MRRGTTPTLKCDITGVNVADLDNIYLTIKQSSVELTKRENEITKDTSDGKNRLLVSLTQEETLEFRDGMVQIQLRATLAGGNAIASNIKTVPLDHILMEGEI